MPAVDPLRALAFHNDWARDTLMTAASSLDDTALDRRFEMGPGSLRLTLRHLWYSENVWLHRWAGRTTTEDAPESVGLEDLWARFRATAERRDAFLGELGAAGLSTRCTYESLEGGSFTIPIGDALLHVLNHGFHHRAQALNMLRRIGAVEPPRLDFLVVAIDPSLRPEIAYDVDTIGEYLRFGDWARHQVLDAAAELDDAALDRPFEMGLGTIRKTLLHVRAAEQWWLEVFNGVDDGFPRLPETTSIARLRQHHDETAAGRRELLAKITVDDLGRVITARPRPDRELAVRGGDALIQLGGHGTHHRAQALNMLRHLGAPTPVIGYRNWCEATSLAGRAG